MSGNDAARFFYAQLMTFALDLLHSATIAVAVPAPLPLLYYVCDQPVARGARVLVPLGKRKVVGVAWNAASAAPTGRNLRSVLQVLDQQPMFTPDLLELAEFASGYYHYPLGEVLQTMLPMRLRDPDPFVPPHAVMFALTEAGCKADAAGLRGKHQSQLLRYLQQHAVSSAAQIRSALPESGPALLRLQALGWIERLELPAFTALSRPAALPALSSAQELVVKQISQELGRFQVSLLEGVTGSGKTEVYLSLVAAAAAQGMQSLLLIPEIGLTPQFMARLRDRLQMRIALLHSQLSDQERAQAWHSAARGEVDVVVGTRSALFTPLPRLGLIVVDEEHDSSYKQAEGLRYSARDLAVKLGQQRSCPVLLGSATPALETLVHARSGRYQHLHLAQRYGIAVAPSLEFIDLRKRALHDGLSEPVLAAIGATLARGEQALIFRNQRGYASAIICHDCGWHGDCEACARPMTWHRADLRLICHHCGHTQKAPRACPSCNSLGLQGRGVGTQRLEEALSKRYPSVPLIRLDRDSTSQRGAMEKRLTSIRDAHAALIVGTQMLAKGHDWPKVTLVVIVDADGALFSADFRAGERLAQLLVQVSGRAGRAELPGKVLLQTHEPEHPLLQAVLRGGYRLAMEHELGERRDTGFPPYSALALLRADSRDPERAQRFIIESQALLKDPKVQWQGPIPALLPKRAERYRFQAWIQAPDKRRLQAALSAWYSSRMQTAVQNDVRWHLDVDPLDVA